MNSDRELGLSKTLTPSYLAVGRAVLLSTFFSFLFRALHFDVPRCVFCFRGRGVRLVMWRHLQVHHR